MSEVGDGGYKYSFDPGTDEFQVRIDWGSSYGLDRYAYGKLVASSGGGGGSTAAEIWNYQIPTTAADGSAAKKLLNSGVHVGPDFFGGVNPKDFMSENKKLAKAIEDVAEKVGNIKFEQVEQSPVIVEPTDLTPLIKELGGLKEALSSLSSIPDSVTGSISKLIEGLSEKLDIKEVNGVISEYDEEKEVEKEFHHSLSIAEKEIEIDGLKETIASLEEKHNMAMKKLEELIEEKEERDEKIKKLKSTLE